MSEHGIRRPSTKVFGQDVFGGVFCYVAHPAQCYHFCLKLLFIFLQVEVWSYHLCRMAQKEFR
jgi:hypothetical protein